MRALRWLARWVGAPWVRFFVGAVLMASGLSDAVDAFEDDFTRQALELHHGVLLLGCMHVLQALPELADGVLRVAGKDG